ncbi:MAG: sigma-70 family RNA polymerase sigma factor [Flavobacteriales bacterium]
MNSTPNDIIAQWVNEFTDELFRYAYYKVSDKEIAEDLVQNTFLAAVSSFNNFKQESSPKTWLYSILKNKIMDHHRIKFRRAEVKSDDDSILDFFFTEGYHWKNETSPEEWDHTEELLDNEDFNLTLKNCLDKLPPKWNAALQLKYMEDRDGKIICQELDITATNFWQILHRAKLQLRECIERNWYKK